MVTFTVIAASTLIAYLVGRLHGWQSGRASVAADVAFARLFGDDKSDADRAAIEAEWR